MKLLFVLLLLQVPLPLQQQISYNYVEIPASQYLPCKGIKYLMSTGQFTSKGGKLVIPIEGKSPKVFKDNGEMLSYEYLGDIQHTKLSVVKCMEPNDEYCFVVNRKTGDVDTLLSEPIFAADRVHFVCVNNPGTDQQLYIQIGELTDGVVRLKAKIRGKKGSFSMAVGCVYNDYVLLKDNVGKYWKLVYKFSPGSSK